MTYKTPPVELNFKFPGEPKAIQSVRFANIGGFVRKYQPKENVEWKNWLKIQAMQQLPDNFVCTDKPCRVYAKFVFALPKGARAQDRRDVEEGFAVLKITRPDLADNLFKGLIDSLNGIVWRDDSQIVEVHGFKFYGSEPYISVNVRIAE